MPRRHRKDYRGAWWHLMNRGVEKRTLFHTPEEGRYFLELLARVVRALRVEFHAYCVMPNHFHLIARSLDGRISRTMHWVEYMYARAFNEAHERSGALFQGRFRGKLIHSLTYRRAATIYVHENPIRAGLDSSCEYFWESSLPFHESGEGRPWVARRFVRYGLGGWKGLHPELVERWIDDKAPDSKEVDVVLQSSVSQLAGWLRNRAGASPGTRQPRSLLHERTVRRTLRAERREHGEMRVSPRGHSRDALEIMVVGTLHELSGLSKTAISELLGVPGSTVDRRVEEHRAALMSDSWYLNLAARVLARCLESDYRRLGDTDE